MSDRITVQDNGHPVTLTFNAINTYHGGGFPDGVAHAFKAMQAAFPLLSEKPLERREITIVTAFTGPGGRDALEMVTRAVTGGRIVSDRSIGGRDILADPPGPCVFRFSYRGRTVEAALRPGHVREEFVRLGEKKNKTLDEVLLHEELKAEMANRLLPQPATDIYAVRVIDE